MTRIGEGAIATSVSFIATILDWRTGCVLLAADSLGKADGDP